MLPAFRILSLSLAFVFVEMKFYRNFLFLLFFMFPALLAAVKCSTCAKLYVCVIKSHFLKDMETPSEFRHRERCERPSSTYIL